MVNTSNKLSKIISIIHDISNDLLINDSPKTLYYPINYHLSNQGKRTRSILCLLSFNLFNNRFIDCKELILAIDSLHEFTLIHDDIMDSATVRRGQATINTKWSNNQAILSGDVVLIKAYQHLLSLPNFNKYLLNHFTEIAIKICEGQQIDMDMQQKTTIALKDYLHMINLKTGALIQFSLVSPAIMLGLHNNVILKLRHIGMYIGHLFQIQDDYLDIYGQYSSTGKTIGIDSFWCFLD
ncbi:polyprenyl synthetase family protein [Flavobacteriales bacterium]|nr:polyprenyl synthetase family protein [Flavobacteriales bacterium]